MAPPTKPAPPVTAIRRWSRGAGASGRSTGAWVSRTPPVAGLSRGCFGFGAGRLVDAGRPAGAGRLVDRRVRPDSLKPCLDVPEERRAARAVVRPVVDPEDH